MNADVMKVHAYAGLLADALAAHHKKGDRGSKLNVIAGACLFFAASAKVAGFDLETCSKLLREMWEQVPE